MGAFHLTLILFVSIIVSVNSHTEILNVNGGTVGQRNVRERSPVMDYQSPDMVCGLGPKPSSGPLKLKAGDKVTVNFLNTGRAPEKLDPSHKGPCQVYIAEFSETPSKFSKIFEEGFSGGVETSCNTKISKTGAMTFSIPSNLKSGKYILRTELIALHEANREGGAQPYVQCIDIEVEGSGTVGVGANAVTIPGHWKASDPGIKFDIYNMDRTKTPYPIPGPRVDSAFKFDGSSSGSTPASGSPPAGNTPASGSPPAGSSPAGGDPPVKDPPKKDPPPADSTSKDPPPTTSSPAPDNNTGAKPKCKPRTQNKRR